MKEIFYEWYGLNRWLFHAINNLHGDAYDKLMLLGSALADHYLLPIYLAAIIIVAAARLWQFRSDAQAMRGYAMRWFEVICVFTATFVIGGLVVYGLKHGLHFPRPYADPLITTLRPLGAPFSEKLAHLSFPSGHSAFAALLVASLWPVLNRGGKVVACLYVLWVCWSRIALGVHYPADVLASVLLTVPGTYLAHRIVTRSLRLLQLKYRSKESHNETRPT